MPILESQADRNSEEFKRNRQEMLAAIQEFRGAEASVQAASEKSRERFRKRRQLMPRERIALLLDRGAPFLELMPLAGYRMHDDKDGSSAGGGSVAGIGYVEGVRCMLTASNSAIKGGTVAPSGQRKGQRVQQVVMENKLPVVNLVESGGANLLYQAEIFVPGGRGFANQARMSARGIPQVTVVHGSSTAGGAYLPGLSDYVIMVRNQAKVFLAGPPLLKAATGEIATDEDLGGAEMHATVSGVAEWMAENDADGLRMAREVIAKWHWNDKLPPKAMRPFKEPLYDIDELCGVVPPSHKDPYDVREVIARLVDGSDFLEFKGLYDQQTICGWAELEGEPVAFIGNNGPITTKGSVKAAQFIQLCCQQGTPIVYLQNTTGYMVGTEAERGGIVKHGSKMIQAVANATVPQITIVIGGSFGAGNYGMCGRAYDPRFIFAWPNNRTAVMGGEQAAGVMKTVTEQKFLREGKEPPKAEIDKMFKSIVDQFDRESTALYGTAHLWDDGIIDPRDTRRVLAFTLSIAREREGEGEHAAGVARVDDAVVPQMRGAVERGRFAVELVDDALEHLVDLGARRLLALAQELLLGHGLHHAGGLLAAHHGGAVVGPGEDEARIVGAAAHAVVARAEAAADHDGDLRHRRVGHRLDHLGAVLDDAAALGLGADHVAGGVLQIDDRRALLAAQLDELRRLDRALGGDRAVVADERHRLALDLGPAADRLLIIEALELEEVRAVDQPRDHLAHIVRILAGRRHDSAQLVDVVERLLVLPCRMRRQLVVPMPPGDHLARHADAVGIVLGHPFRDARDGGVHLRAAQLLVG